MTITNRLGRPMIAAMFVSGGADQLMHPDEKVEVAADVVDEIDDRVDGVPLPSETRDVVRINGAVQVAAGTLLAINKVPRLASMALAASLVPTTLGAHRFWEIDDEDARAQQRIHFLKNLAMLGGLLITIGDTGREPSMGWRARRAVRKAGSDITDAAADVRRSGAETAAGIAGAVGGAAASATDALPTSSAGGPEFSTPDMSAVADDARDIAHNIRDASAPTRKALRGKAKDLASSVRSVDVAARRDDVADQARALADKASELASSATSKVSKTSRFKMPKVRFAR